MNTQSKQLDVAKTTPIQQPIQQPALPKQQLLPNIHVQPQLPQNVLPQFGMQTFNMDDQGQLAQLIQTIVSVLQQFGILNNQNNQIQQIQQQPPQNQKKPKKQSVRKDTPRNRFIKEYMDDEKNKEENDYVHIRLMRSASKAWEQMDPTEKYRKYGVLNDFPKGVSEYNVFVKKKTQEIKNELKGKKNGEPTREEVRAELSKQWKNCKNTPVQYDELHHVMIDENNNRRIVREKIKQQNDIIASKINKELEIEHKLKEEKDKERKEELRLKEIEQQKERQKNIIYPQYGLETKGHAPVSTSINKPNTKPKPTQTILFKKTTSVPTHVVSRTRKSANAEHEQSDSSDIILTDINEEKIEILKQLDETKQSQQQFQNDCELLENVDETESDSRIKPLSDEEFQQLLESSKSLDPFGDESNYEFEEEFEEEFEN